MEGSSLQADLMQKVLELVVHERMSQVEKARGTKERKKVKGWFIGEIKDKPNSLLQEDTEEMRKWRGVSQDEKELAEKIEEEVLDKYKVEDSKREAFFLRQRCSAGMEAGAKKKKYRIRKW